MSRSAHRLGYRWALVAVVWAAALLAEFAVAWTTKLGPVLVIFTRGHGVHLGDVAALAGFFLIAALVSARILRSSRTR